MQAPALLNVQGWGTQGKYGAPIARIALGEIAAGRGHHTLMVETLEPYVGHLAGVATAMLWTATLVLFTAAGRRIGPTAVNFSRMLFAIVLLGVTHRLVSGAWWPDAVTKQVVSLGVLGLLEVIGLPLRSPSAVAARFMAPSKTERPRRP